MVYRHVPFTIILRARADGVVQPTAVKLDPGAATTGLAVVVTGQRGPRLVWAGEIQHRGRRIQTALAARRAQRRARRQRHTRYRAPRFLNRRRGQGWLAPSLRSRAENVVTWVARLRRWCPVGALAQELVRFDTQQMQDAEIRGVAYQQGTLAGYEVRQYLLDKWQRTCAYCGQTGIPLEIEHIVPRSRGGSDRVSNLTLACHRCNQQKGQQTAAEFGYPQVQAQAQRPLTDAAVVNTTRWALYQRLSATRLPVEVGTGGRTHFNRIAQGYPKTHWLDAACVGMSGAHVFVSAAHVPLCIQATGRQHRQMTLVDPYGFPRAASKGPRVVHGIQTGDRVRAVVPRGKRQGTHGGRVAVKASGTFTIHGTPDIPWRFCRKLQAADGYDYTKGEPAASPVA